MSTPEAGTPGAPAQGFNADIKVLVYMASDGYRWRIKSTSRGRDVLGVSSQGYSNKASAFRSLLLTTGGTYTQLYRHVHKEHGVYEQGVILRLRSYAEDGSEIERIFVEFRNKVPREELEAFEGGPQ